MQVTYSERIKIAIYALIFFLSALVLLHQTSKDKTIIQIAYRGISEVIFPFQNANKKTKNFFKNTYNNYIHLTNLKKNNNELTLKNLKLEEQILKLKEAEFENKNLRRLLNMKRHKRIQSLGAEIIGFDSSKWGRAVIIDRGIKDGGQIGDAGVSYEGVAGQIVALSKNSSKVLLTIDRTSAIDVFLQESRARGVLEGGGRELCNLKYVLKNSDVKKGYKVLTSGLDGVFPKGLLIGYVTSFKPANNELFDVIKVTPAVDFTKLEHVLIFKKSYKKEK